MITLNYCNISINSIRRKQPAFQPQSPSTALQRRLVSSPSNYLHFWWPSFVAYQQQMTLIVDEHLLLEAATLRRFLLDVLARQVAVHQRRLARAQRAHDAQPQLWNGARDRPLLAVYKGVWKWEEKGRETMLDVG